MKKHLGTLHGIPVVSDSSLKEGEVRFGTATWYRNDTYRFIMPCKNRLLTAWRALTKGVVHIEYLVPSNKRDKTLRLKGERVGWFK